MLNSTVVVADDNSRNTHYDHCLKGNCIGAVGWASSWRTRMPHSASHDLALTFFRVGQGNPNMVEEVGSLSVPA